MRRNKAMQTMDTQCGTGLTDFAQGGQSQGCLEKIANVIVDKPLKSS